MTMHRYRNSGLFSKMFSGLALSSAAAILIIILVLGRMMLERAQHQFERELVYAAKTTAVGLSDTLQTPTDIIKSSMRLLNTPGLRLTVVAADGHVLADSEQDDPTVNHADRPEIIQILREHKDVGKAERFSQSLNTHMLYIAVPVFGADGKVSGACRVSRSLKSMHNERGEIIHRLVLIGIVATALCWGVGWFISRRVVQSVRKFISTLRKIRSGDFDAQVRLTGAAETVELSEEFANMMNDIRLKTDELSRGRARFGAVLDGMTDGILVLDDAGMMVISNEHARTVLGVPEPEGRSVFEVLRIPALTNVIEAALNDQKAQERDAVIPPREAGGEERTVLVRTYPNVANGILVVLTDVTRLKRLENLRSEFTANVSHELRTPVTAISGFVETLLDGAVDDPDNARRFLKIIHAHTYRLGALIKDLMALSRLERADATGTNAFEELPLAPFILQVEDLARERAAEKGVTLMAHCADDLQATINSGLFTQAVSNLIENAIVYSSAGGAITVTGERKGDEVLVRVHDRGCGIPPEHLERIFERFYTIDPARSRASGGTGLGLAIVKHVMQVHGGKVTVESQVGRGSTFTLHFPA